MLLICNRHIIVKIKSRQNVGFFSTKKNTISKKFIYYFLLARNGKMRLVLHYQNNNQ